MKTILINITTHKRPKWCLQLLKDLHSQREGYNIKIAVFHDKDDTDYSKVKEFCKDNGYTYLQTRENMGKWRYWEMLNLTYWFADNQEYDYWISLPDDCVPVKDFFKRATDLITPEYKLVNFFTMNIHARSYQGCKHIKIGNQIAMLSNWVDGCFVSTKEYMQGLRIPMPQATKSKRYNRGSGIAHELIKFFNNRNYRIPQTYYALVEHIGNIETVMHDAKRRQELYGDRTSKEIASSLTEKDTIFIKSKLKYYGIHE